LSRIPLLGNLFKSRRSTKTKRQLMIFLRPIILRDAATEAAVSSEKYNFLRAEQLKMRENRELRFREQQPVLPALPDLMRAPPAHSPTPEMPTPGASVSPVESTPKQAASPDSTAPRAPRRVPGHPVAHTERDKDRAQRD
jgi:general secretion pathway protein D